MAIRRPYSIHTPAGSGGGGELGSPDPHFSNYCARTENTKNTTTSCRHSDIQEQKCFLNHHHHRRCLSSHNQEALERHGKQHTPAAAAQPAANKPNEPGLQFLLAS
ncbi:hypothetical protein E2C01_032190 [Portunus trituberculatus]|uniref:Uncharacterized protein n=1 Tax=Portunus trituberculatus TaxID=210409 RepID=A0A5B7F091_PORTR|nr:hypothetical protein [Portunus trituberculatus]